MIKIKEHTLEEVITTVQQRLQSATKRVKQAQELSLKRYYKGQVDALTIILQDLTTLKFEWGMELSPETDQQEPEQSQIKEPSQQEPAQPKRKRRRKQPTPKVQPEQTEVSPYQALVREAIQKGIIRQRYSVFYHEQLPTTGVRGFRGLYQALEENPVLRQAVQGACARSESSAPSEEQQ